MKWSLKKCPWFSTDEVPKRQGRAAQQSDELGNMFLKFALSLKVQKLAVLQKTTRPCSSPVRRQCPELASGLLFTPALPLPQGGLGPFGALSEGSEYIRLTKNALQQLIIATGPDHGSSIDCKLSDITDHKEKILDLEKILCYKLLCESFTYIFCVKLQTYQMLQQPGVQWDQTLVAQPATTGPNN